MAADDRRADCELDLAVNMSSSLEPEDAEDLVRDAMARKPGEEREKTRAALESAKERVLEAK